MDKIVAISDRTGKNLKIKIIISNDLLKKLSSIQTVEINSLKLFNTAVDF